MKETSINNTKKIKLKISFERDAELNQPWTREIEVEVPPEGVHWESIGENPEEMLRMMVDMAILAIAKGKTYGDSWRKKGEVLSIWPNVMRKYDRVEKSIMDQVEGRSFRVGPRIDGTGDFVVYGLLYLQFLKENHPEEFEKWMNSEVHQYVQDNLGGMTIHESSH